MSELIDIFDANLKQVGTSERKEAHLKGEWHRTFHLWLSSSRNGGTLLFQLRSPTANNFPNLLDITVAGHLLSGEQPADGLREVSEELGIDPSQLRLQSLGYRVEVADQENGQRNREYQAVFLAMHDIPLGSYKPDPDEVYGLVDISIKDGFDLFQGRIDNIHAPALVYDQSDCCWQETVEMITSKRFLPRIQQYYLTMLIMAERFIEGRSPISIS